MPDGWTPVIENSPRVDIASNIISSQLQFRPVQQSDNGSYSCNATIDGSTLISDPITVAVNGSANNIISLQYLTLIILYSLSSSPSISLDQR